MVKVGEMFEELRRDRLELCEVGELNDRYYLSNLERNTAKRGAGSELYF